MDAEFWERCIELNIVVVPIKLYSRFKEDSKSFTYDELDESSFLGIKFGCISSGWSEIVMDKDGKVFIYVDDMITNANHLFATPKEAVDDWENNHGAE